MMSKKDWEFEEKKKDRVNLTYKQRCRGIAKYQKQKYAEGGSSDSESSDSDDASSDDDANEDVITEAKFEKKKTKLEKILEEDRFQYDV